MFKLFCFSKLLNQILRISVSDSNSFISGISFEKLWLRSTHQCDPYEVIIMKHKCWLLWYGEDVGARCSWGKRRRRTNWSRKNKKRFTDILAKTPYRKNTAKLIVSNVIAFIPLYNYFITPSRLSKTRTVSYVKLSYEYVTPDHSLEVVVGTPSWDILTKKTPEINELECEGKPFKIWVNNFEKQKS